MLFAVSRNGGRFVYAYFLFSFTKQQFCVRVRQSDRQTVGRSLSRGLFFFFSSHSTTTYVNIFSYYYFLSRPITVLPCEVGQETFIVACYFYHTRRSKLSLCMCAYTYVCVIHSFLRVFLKRFEKSDRIIITAVFLAACLFAR